MLFALSLLNICFQRYAANGQTGDNWIHFIIYGRNNRSSKDRYFHFKQGFGQISPEAYGDNTGEAVKWHNLDVDDGGNQSKIDIGVCGLL